MRFFRTGIALVLAALPLAGLAKGWHGINPGSSKRADIVTQFGDPTGESKIEGKPAIVYKAEQAIEGTRAVQFLMSENGTVAKIVVFPVAKLDPDSVEGTYGKPEQKTFTDNFLPVWVYKRQGLMVFFGKDKAVSAISFEAPQRAAADSASK